MRPRKHRLEYKFLIGPMLIHPSRHQGYAKIYGEVIIHFFEAIANLRCSWNSNFALKVSIELSQGRRSRVLKLDEAQIEAKRLFE